MSTEPNANEAPVQSLRSTVSLLEFQMTVANLSIAEHALREEPYERLPYLAGLLQVARSHMEEAMLRQRLEDVC